MTCTAHPPRQQQRSSMAPTHLLQTDEVEVSFGRVNAVAGGSESLLEPAGVTSELLQELRSAVQAAVASEPTSNGKGQSAGPLRARICSQFSSVQGLSPFEVSVSCAQ